MGALKEVYKNIEKEGTLEVEKYEAAKNSPDFKQEDWGDEELTDMLNKDDFKQVLGTAREQGETFITNTETNIRSLIGQDRSAMQMHQQEMLVERNRRAIKNFIEFVQKETNDINEKLLQQIEDD